jgi:hypothetical protein
MGTLQRRTSKKEILFVIERNWMLILDADSPKSDDFYQRNVSELKCLSY